MFHELFVLVVTTITPVTGTTTYESMTAQTFGLTFEQCEKAKNATYNNAVEKKLNVVVKCVPQD